MAGFERRRAAAQSLRLNAERSEDETRREVKAHGRNPRRVPRIEAERSAGSEASGSRKAAGAAAP
ncbi:MAG: hypothetical protein HY894_03280 [Deltaproteobacteria bacterium]|nr:hypothetical protein [Deltaproteobacteria bacterium]